MRKLLLAAAVLSLFSTSAFAADASSAEDKAKVITISRTLEADPLAANGRELRTWAIKFISEAPDVAVIVCMDPMSDLLHDKRYKYSGELLTQEMIGQAAFVIEHPEVDPKSTGAIIGGMTSMLKAYQSLLAKDPKAKRDYLDAIVDPAALAEHVKTHSAECHK